MIRKITLLISALVLVHLVSLAQPRCGFDALHQKLMATDPAYVQAQAEFRQRWAAYMDAWDKLPQSLKQTLANGTDTVFEIPVVVHVLHTGGAVGTQYNPSDSDIVRYIRYTNEAWEAAYSGYPTPTTGGTRVPIKFVLAKRDTACNAATGIVRVNATAATSSNYTIGGMNHGTSTSGIDEAVLKALSRWDKTMYYNIWIVNKIDTASGYYPGSFVAGFAYLANGSGPTFDALDGTVILASRVHTGAGATGGGPGDITLPHELGHAFNLKHVFDPTPNASCPPTTNCSTTGDEVCDTQPVASSAFGCPAPPTVTCNGAAYDPTIAHNFMDYSNCQDRFTNGQKLRMMYALKTLSARSTYITSLGATPPPTVSLPTACNITASNPGNGFNIGPRNIIISDVVFGPGADTLMHVRSGGYNDDANKAYIDFTCKHRVTLKAGKTYNLLVNVGTSTTTSKAKVFIDYNNDGIFSTAGGERVMSSTGGPGYKTTTFTVPTSASTVMCTPIRMRVLVDAGNGVNVDSCGGLDYGQGEDYTVFILGTGGSSASGSVVINNPPIGGNPSCFGTQLTFYTDTSSGLIVTGYKWYVNDVEVSGQTTDTFKTSTLLNNDRVYARAFYSTPCGIDSAKSNTDTIFRAVTVAPSVTIGIQSGTIPGCVDDTVTFRMLSNVNPGGAPAYQWQVNTGSGFVNVSGQTTTTFKAFGYPSGTQVRLQMTSSAGAPCAIPSTGVSNVYVLTYTTRAPIVSIALTVGTNPGCAGQNLTFTATPTTGGTSPTYSWRVNGVVQTGVTGNTFTKVLADGDTVTCVLTSSSPCASPTTATSNKIGIDHVLITADVSISQTTPSPYCDGKPTVFDATTVNSGAGPLYQWMVNGANVGAPGSATFTFNAHKNDVVKCVFIASDPCVANATDTSDELVVDTKPSDSGYVTMKITKGKDPGCLDSLIEFTGSVVRLGVGPVIDWLVNGFPAASGSTFSTTSLLSGDVVVARARQTDGNCYVADTVYSAPDTMMRSITLDPPIIHLIGNTMFVDRPGKFIWFGPSGMLTGGGNGQYHPTAVGPYYAIADNNGCWSKPSNILTVTLLDISTIDLQGLEVYPNPSKGVLTLDWKGKKVTVSIDIYNQVGQRMKHDELKDGSVKHIDLSTLANGEYFISIKDEAGHSGLVKVALSR